MCPCVPDRIGSNLEVLVFEERGKLENRRKTSRSKGKNLQQRVMDSWQQTRSSTHIWRRRRDLNPGHIAGRRVLSPLRHPCPRQTLSWLRWKPKWAIKGHSIVPVFRPKRKTIPFGAAHTYMVHHIGEYIPLGTLADCPYRHFLTGLGWNVSYIGVKNNKALLARSPRSCKY